MATVNLSNLSDTLRTAASAINQRIDENIDTLKFHEIQELTNKSQDLIMKSKTLLEMQAVEMAQDGKDALNDLTEATDKINKAIKTVETVQKVANITGKLVVVAGSVITGNIVGIATSVQKLIGLL